MTKSIGRYKILQSIAKGGMGEVFLAHDPLYQRTIALKQVREDLKKHKNICNRFLKEAKLTACLTHPGIIPIYSIHESEPFPYYTMPYIEGTTLLELLRKQPSPTIASMIPIFKSICQTVCYAHAQGILHRDLKPENILIGKYGEVIILDWGVAVRLSDKKEETLEESPEKDPTLTKPGKTVGTLAYMAPERATGKKATVQTEVYALGVILYKMLTLHLPFSHRTLKNFKKQTKLEKIIDPQECAPYRDVPIRLAKITKKCLAYDPKKRTESVSVLLAQIENFLLGRAQWFEQAKLDCHQKDGWQFQENIFVQKNLAITHSFENSGWVNMMVSVASFPENIRMQTEITLGATGEGIGFLLSVPEAHERKNLLDGYCLWLGSEKGPPSQLLRNRVEVMHLPQIQLQSDTCYPITLEKSADNLHFQIGDHPPITYVSHLPLVGTHVGILARDADYQLKPITIFVGSQNLQVSCLKIADAFLDNKDYERALLEYRRIGYAFSGHAEGREALFRAGITLLEQAQYAQSAKEKDHYYSSALYEFSALHNTPGAPYEYLGKSLVYQALEDFSEEVKYLELGLRRYHSHPLRKILEEQIIYRMHETAQKKRAFAYQLITIVIRLLPDAVYTRESKALFDQLTKNWEPLFFIEKEADSSLLNTKYELKERHLNELRLCIRLGFWLAAPYLLQELFEHAIATELFDLSTLGDLIHSLIILRQVRVAEGLFTTLLEHKEKFAAEDHDILDYLSCLLVGQLDCLSKAIKIFTAIEVVEVNVRNLRTLIQLTKLCIKEGKADLIHGLCAPFLEHPLAQQDHILIDSMRIWGYLINKQFDLAEEVFDTYPIELLNQESTYLHPLYGCFLLVTEPEEEIAEILFAGVIDTPYPRTWALLAHQLTHNILENPSWFSQSFLYERQQLYSELELYYLCAENPEEAHRFHLLASQR